MRSNALRQANGHTSLIDAIKGFSCRGCVVAVALSLWFTTASGEEDCPEGECLDDRFNAEVNLRYANVDDSINETANALTARILMSLNTPFVGNFRAVFTAEHVNDLGINTYNDGGSNGQVQYAVEADPSGTEMDQMYVEYVGDMWGARYGRQYIDHGELPQRYVSTASWRQNYQTFDALTVSGQIGDDILIETAFIEKVYRVIGRSHPNRAAREWDLDGIAVHAVFRNTPIGEISPYFYNLDFVDRAELSSRTIGIRMEGPCEAWAGTCIAEIATQKALGDQASDANLINLRSEFGVDFSNFAENNTTGSVSLGATLLEGDSETSFKTPLAALHGYAGWADRFLVNTPPDGLMDIRLRLDEVIFGWEIAAAFHKFRANRSSIASTYGTELDMVASKIFGKYEWTLKMARYKGNAVWKPLPWGNNVTKFWLEVEFPL